MTGRRNDSKRRDAARDGGTTMGTTHPMGRAAVALLAGLGLALSSCASVQSFARDESSKLIERYRKAADARSEAAQTAEKETPPPQVSIDDLLAQGDQFRDEGELGDAMFHYVRAHRTDAARIEPGERIAFLHLRKDPARAETLFEVLLEREPYSASLRTGLALAELAQGDLERARIELDEAIALDPRAATPRLLLGVVLDRTDDHAAAQEQYEQAHALRPNDWVILNNLGVSHLMAGEPEAAETSLRRAVRLRPRDAALRNNLGLALGLQGLHDEALRQFREVASEPEARNNLGWVLYLSGDYAGALEQFERALDVEGDAVLTVLRNIELASAALGHAPDIGFEALPVETAESTDATEEPS